MVNILKFPDQRTALDDQEFLKGDDDTLRFDAKGELAIPNVYAPDLNQKPSSKDWTNQELADLFRVKHLLGAAGIVSETDRGITDEGDPWFIFCNARGEVFIHLCRLSQEYLLDSSGIKSPITGRNFTELLESFTKSELQSQASEDAPEKHSHRVVRFHRNGTVLLHPTTMLAALVWTLFLESEDIVMVLPEDAKNANDTLSKTFASLSEGSDETKSASAEQHYEDSFVINGSEEVGKVDKESVEHHLSVLFSPTDEKVTYNTYAVGLSMIAICLGFVSETRVADIDEVDPKQLLQFSTINANVKNYQNLDVTEPQTKDIGDFLTVLADIVISVNAFSQGPVLSDESNNILGTAFGNSSAECETTLCLDFTTVEVKTSHPEKLNLHKDSDGLASNHQNIDTTINTLLSSSSVAVQEIEHTFGLSFSDFIHAFQSTVHEYKVNENTILADFDVDVGTLQKVNNFITTSEFSQKSNPMQGELQRLDNQAHDFIVFLMENKDGVEIMSVDGEWILFDTTIFDANPEEAIFMSWSLDSGDLISMIGLRSDYEAFDLIA